MARSSNSFAAMITVSGDETCPGTVTAQTKRVEPGQRIEQWDDDDDVAIGGWKPDNTDHQQCCQ